MTVKEILADWLKSHNWDGLAGDECGCELNDLMPCDSPDQCVPGIRGPCDCGESHDWHIVSVPACKCGRPKRRCKDCLDPKRSQDE